MNVDTGRLYYHGLDPERIAPETGWRIEMFQIVLVCIADLDTLRASG
jgi:hypothetical protein